MDFDKNVLVESYDEKYLSRRSDPRRERGKFDLKNLAL